METVLVATGDRNFGTRFGLDTPLLAGGVFLGAFVDSPGGQQRKGPHEVEKRGRLNRQGPVQDVQGFPRSARAGERIPKVAEQIRVSRVFLDCRFEILQSLAPPSLTSQRPSERGARSLLPWGAHEQFATYRFCLIVPVERIQDDRQIDIRLEEIGTARKARADRWLRLFIASEAIQGDAKIVVSLGELRRKLRDAHVHFTGFSYRS